MALSNRSGDSIESFNWKFQFESWLTALLTHRSGILLKTRTRLAANHWKASRLCRCRRRSNRVLWKFETKNFTEKNHWFAFPPESLRLTSANVRKSESLVHWIDSTQQLSFFKVFKRTNFLQCQVQQQNVQQSGGPTRAVCRRWITAEHAGTLRFADRSERRSIDSLIEAEFLGAMFGH